MEQSNKPSLHKLGYSTLYLSSPTTCSHCKGKYLELHQPFTYHFYVCENCLVTVRQIGEKKYFIY